MSRLCAGLLLAAFLALAAALPGPARAQDGPRVGRGGWALLLVGYGVVSAATVAGTYLLRDNFAGRSLATGAGTWGGMSVGAVVGRSLAASRPQPSSFRYTSASDDEGAATVVGALLGGVAGSIAAFLLTGERGLSRPYTAAGGMTPALLFFAAGTILDW